MGYKLYYVVSVFVQNFPMIYGWNNVLIRQPHYIVNSPVLWLIWLAYCNVQTINVNNCININHSVNGKWFQTKVVQHIIWFKKIITNNPNIVSWSGELLKDNFCHILKLPDGLWNGYSQL